MVNSVSIFNGEAGLITARIRNFDGTLDISRLQEILDNHPEALTEEEALALLGESVEMIREMRYELSSTKRELDIVKAAEQKRLRTSLQEDKRELRKNLDLIKALGAKKPRQVSRETIRGNYGRFFIDADVDEDHDDGEDLAGEVYA